MVSFNLLTTSVVNGTVRYSVLQSHADPRRNKSEPTQEIRRRKYVPWTMADGEEVAQFKSAQTAFPRPLHRNVDLTHKTPHVRTHTAQQQQLRQHSGGQLLLITGPTGSGKTRLVQDTFGDICHTGKFDALCRPEPYRAFAMAVTAWANSGNRKVVLPPEECQVLEEVIPALERCWENSGKDMQDTAVSCKNADEYKQSGTPRRFGSLFRKLLGKLAREGKDEAVFLFEDLQYADRCSLEVLGNVMVDFQALGAASKVMIAATFDTSMQSSSVTQFLDEQTSLGRIKKIQCPKLSVEEVADFLETVTEGCSESAREELVRVVSRETEGNLFQVTELVRWMDGSGFADFQHSKKIPHIVRSTSDTGILRRNLMRQPHDVLDVLRVAACLGPQIDETLIGYVVRDTIQRPIEVIIAEASAAGFLEERGGIHVFVHDGVQNAAYECIPEEDRNIFHVSVGRRLLLSLDQAGLDQHIFVVLSQINIGKDIITELEERNNLANLCLFAGRKAARWAAFPVASVYMNLGIELLDKGGWNDNYELALALHNGAAEMNACSGVHSQIDILAKEVNKNARNRHDSLQIESTRIYAMGISGRQNDAINHGLEILASLGETFPKENSHFHLIVEAVKVKWLMRHWILGTKGDEHILNLSPMTNPDKLACVRTINLLVLHSLMFRPYLVPFLALRVVKLTLLHGMSLMAPQAFACFSSVLANLGEFDVAFRFGELALNLMDHLGHDECLPRVYASYYGTISAFRIPAEDAMVKHLHAYRVGMQTGDFEFGFLNMNM